MFGDVFERITFIFVNGSVSGRHHHGVPQGKTAGFAVQIGQALFQRRGVFEGSTNHFALVWGEQSRPQPLFKHGHFINGQFVVNSCHEGKQTGVGKSLLTGEFVHGVGQHGNPWRASSQ